MTFGIKQKILFWIRRRMDQLASEKEPRSGSERKAPEATLSEAERLATSRSELFAQMSHELRTPLNAILGYAQILRRDEHVTERQARGLATIEESGQRLLALINDILDVSRLSASKLELEPTDIHLAMFLRTVCDIVRAKADEKCLEFTYQGAPDLPMAVRIDSKRLQQVLLNLLGNAVKFTHSGRIQLRVVKLAAPDEQQDLATARLLFEVEDSGIGMTGQQLETIFLPFEQALDAKRRQGGAGLGLAISRQLVQLMGGDIQVRSEPGQGSIFRFELSVPIAASEPDTVAHAPESTTVDPEEIVTPPLAEMETLYKLALTGSMREIRDRANYLASADPRYASFVRRLQSLAQAYQSQAILALVVRYRAQAALLERSTELHK